MYLTALIQKIKAISSRVLGGLQNREVPFFQGNV